MGAPSLQLLRSIILRSFLNMFFFSHFPPLIHSKFCQLYIQNISRIWSFFIMSIVTTLGHLTWVIPRPPNWTTCFCPCTITIYSQQTAVDWITLFLVLFWNLIPMASIHFGEAAQVLIMTSMAQHNWFLTLARETATQQVVSPLISCSSWDGQALLEQQNVGGIGCHWVESKTDHCSCTSCLPYPTSVDGCCSF